MSAQDQPVYLLAITPELEQPLFRSYRDYLVFLSLTRELAQAENYQIYGFSWLQRQAYILCHSANNYIADPVVQMMKRYYYWLQVAGRANHEFKLQMIRLSDSADYLEALKFIHLQVIEHTKLSDPLAYHWHSYPVYHDYWQLNWLLTQPMLELYSRNKIIAMNQFREHMLKPVQSDFVQRLKTDNEARRQISSTLGKDDHKEHQIACPVSDYHRCLNHEVKIEITIDDNDVLVGICFIKD